MTDTRIPQTLTAGDTCPSVELDTHRGDRWNPASPARPTVLVLVPAAFSPICGGEIDELVALAPTAESAGVDLVVASCDAPAVLLAWLEAHGAAACVTAASDFWPHGALARGLGAFDEHVGQAKRWSFAVDAAGRIVDAVSAFSGDARPLAAHARLVRRAAAA